MCPRSQFLDMLVRLSHFRSPFSPFSLLQDRRIGAKPHGAAEIAADAAFLQFVAFHPFGHQANDRLRRGDEFGRIGPLDGG